jgi:hypothetical protein
MPCNEPNVIIRDNKEDMSVMDRTISGDRNVIRKETEKISKYKHLAIVIKYMQNLNKKSIPVIIQVIRTSSKSFRKYLNNTPGKRNPKELQKTSILDTAHLLWKALMKVQKFYHTK